VKQRNNLTLRYLLWVMPAAGSSTPSGPFHSDLGMPSTTSFETEFLLEEENFQPSGTGLFDLDSGEPFDSVAFEAPKALLGSAGRQVHSAAGVVGFSPPSHRDSSSSSSSRRSADSDSPKTSHTSGDAMMTDEVGTADWKGMHGLPMSDDGSFQMFDGLDHSVDPSSHFNDSNFFDFESASSSPNANASSLQASLSPEMSTNGMRIPVQSPKAKRQKGHNKAQSVIIILQSDVRCSIKLTSVPVATFSDTVYAWTENEWITRSFALIREP
jgi:hypothetical protein